jgi:hypothetical protein
VPPACLHGAKLPLSPLDLFGGRRTGDQGV